jgi:hypothetical protein
MNVADDGWHQTGKQKFDSFLKTQALKLLGNMEKLEADEVQAVDV